MCLEEKIQVLRRGFPEPGSKTSESLEGFRPPRTLPGGQGFQRGLPKAFQARCREALQKAKEASWGGSGQVRKTPPARQFRFCAGGRLRPEGLLIVSILYAGVCLEVCETKIQASQGFSGASQARGLLNSLFSPPALLQPGASQGLQGPPRGLPGASQGPPRGLPGAPGPPRSLPGASQSPSGLPRPSQQGASGPPQGPPRGLCRGLPGASQASQGPPRGPPRLEDGKKGPEAEKSDF